MFSHVATKQTQRAYRDTLKNYPQRSELPVSMRLLLFFLPLFLQYLRSASLIATWAVWSKLWCLHGESRSRDAVFNVLIKSLGTMHPRPGRRSKCCHWGWRNRSAMPLSPRFLFSSCSFTFSVQWFPQVFSFASVYHGFHQYLFFSFYLSYLLFPFPLHHLEYFLSFVNVKIFIISFLSSSPQIHFPSLLSCKT